MAGRGRLPTSSISNLPPNEHDTSSTCSNTMLQQNGLSHDCALPQIWERNVLDEAVRPIDGAGSGDDDFSSPAAIRLTWAGC